MTLHLLRMIPLIACACSLRAADKDEVAFKGTTYTPRTALNGTTYRASTYAPAGTTHVAGTPIQTSAPRSRWRLFTRKPADAPKLATDETAANATPYIQQKNTTVSTLKADAHAIQEKRPLITSDKSVPDTAFKPAEKSEWKNPLLKPRQGIKEHAE